MVANAVERIPLNFQLKKKKEKKNKVPADKCFPNVSVEQGC